MKINIRNLYDSNTLAQSASEAGTKNFVKNGMSFERSIASREWNVYAEKVWQNFCRGERLEAKKEDKE